MRALAVAAAFLVNGLGIASASTAITFKSPQLALRALAEAAAKDDTARITALFGPGAEDVVSSGDPVQDRAARKRFVTLVRERATFEPIGDKTVVAHLGAEDWPFPVPLVKDGDGWRFDAQSAKDEILNRRIGQNELTAISVCRAYVDAQFEYAKVDRTGAGRRTYARKVRSDPGTKDGLYWETPSGAPPSPLGPLVAEATAEGYRVTDPGEPRPYHGYFYRILTGQGAKAPGGAKAYLDGDKLVRGFALIAYPANYGNSGIMTFVVNHDGVVFQKNLGPQTTEIAKAMTAYEPDATWDPAQ